MKTQHEIQIERDNEDYEKRIASEIFKHAKTASRLLKANRRISVLEDNIVTVLFLAKSWMHEYGMRCGHSPQRIEKDISEMLKGLETTKASS